MLDNVKQMQRISFLLMIITVLLGLISIIIYCLTYSLHIKRVNLVDNFVNVDIRLVEDIIKNDVGGNFLTVNLSKLSRDIKRINWVKNVYIEREFPNSINVRIDEYIPLAFINNYSTILTKNNEIIHNVYLAELPILYIPLTKINDSLLIYQIGESFAKQKQLKVLSMYYDGFDIVNYLLENNLNITSCRATKLREDLLLLDKYWGKMFNIKSSPNTINMCYQGAIAIK